MALIQMRWNPERRELRSFGWIALGALTLLAALTWWRQAFLWIELSDAVARVLVPALAGAGAVCGLLAALMPGWLKPLYWTLTVITWPIGLVVSHVLMGLLFYAVFTPIALAFRLMRRDVLTRSRDPNVDSYWVRRRLPHGARRYFRQF